jgi:hypothetical protein
VVHAAGRATFGPRGYVTHQPAEARVDLQDIPPEFELNGPRHVTVNASRIDFADGRQPVLLVELGGRAAMTPADAHRVAAALLHSAQLLGGGV